MSDPSEEVDPRRVYNDPGVQKALLSLEASLDESLKSPRRGSFRELLGLRSKKGRPLVVVDVKTNNDGVQVIAAPLEGSGGNYTIDLDLGRNNRYKTSKSRYDVPSNSMKQKHQTP